MLVQDGYRKTTLQLSLNDYIVNICIIVNTFYKFYGIQSMIPSLCDMFLFCVAINNISHTCLDFNSFEIFTEFLNPFINDIKLMLYLDEEAESTENIQETIHSSIQETKQETRLESNQEAIQDVKVTPDHFPYQREFVASNKLNPIQAEYLYTTVTGTFLHWAKDNKIFREWLRIKLGGGTINYTFERNCMVYYEIPGEFKLRIKGKAQSDTCDETLPFCLESCVKYDDEYNHIFDKLNYYLIQSIMFNSETADRAYYYFNVYFLKC